MLKRVLFLWVTVLINFNTGFSSYSYLIDVSNIEKINSHTIEFDVFIKAHTTQFELTSYQCAFTFNPSISNIQKFSFSYVDGSSQLNNIPPEVGIGINTSDGIYKLTFASMPGSENITLTDLRIGRFKLTTAGSFNDLPPEFDWSFSGKINTILTGKDFEEITDSSGHSEANFGQLKIYNIIASSTVEPTSPYNLIDGIGASSGDVNLVWKTDRMPAYLIFDLGENHIINQTRIAYYNWNKGRIYQYSIFAANDTTHWQEIISNASSDSEEYTINNFEKINARFIKLLIIGQNQNEWATLWEVQIYGNDDTTNVSNRTENSKPLVNIPIRIGDGFGDSDTLFVGIDSSACDGLDLYLGETQFQTPSNGVFSAWLNMPNSLVASLKDYRYGCKLQNYEYTYQIQYQKGSANKVTINWNLPVAAKLKIQDVISGKMVDTVFNYGADSITINDPNDIYKLNFTVTYQSRIVPVEITSFNCELNKNNVELAWKTATELNNKGFEIERKLPDKSEWENVGFVRGNGTTVNPTLYKFIDDFKEQTVNGYVSYRLKQINLDGSSSYSNIIEVKVNLAPMDFALYQNYPNPFNPITDIKYAIPLTSNVNIAIFNALGERIQEFNQGIKDAGTHDFIWHATDLASGVYFYTIIAKSADGKNNFRKTQKMMLLK